MAEGPTGQPRMLPPDYGAWDEGLPRPSPHPGEGRTPVPRFPAVAIMTMTLLGSSSVQNINKIIQISLQVITVLFLPQSPRVCKSKLAIRSWPGTEGLTGDGVLHWGRSPLPQMAHTSPAQCFLSPRKGFGDKASITIPWTTPNWTAVPGSLLGPLHRL